MQTTNPVRQIFLWFTELLAQIGANWGIVSQIIAILAFGSMVFVLVQRIQSDEDPSLRYQSSSAGGSMSILISGTHVTMALAGIVGLLTWPLAIQTPAVGVALLGAVVVHFWIEKQETEMN